MAPDQRRKHNYPGEGLETTFAAMGFDAQAKTGRIALEGQAAAVCRRNSSDVLPISGRQDIGSR